MEKCNRCIVVVAVMFIFVAGVAWSAQPRPKTLEIGASAPDFNLPAVDGRYYKLGDFTKADVLVLIFTCNHCPTAQAYEKRMKKLTADYKKKGVAIVAVSPNDPRAVRLDELGYSDMSDSFIEMRIRARDKKFNFPYLYDGDKQKVSRAYGPVATPHVFIFDRQRKLRYVGRIDDSENPKRVKSHDTRNAIEALLSDKEVPVKKTRTFGCSVKWAGKRDSVEQAFERWAKEPVTVEMIDVNGIKDLVANDSKKLRLINVWATWCGPCVVEFDQLVVINRMYRRRDFEMITISGDSPRRKDRVLEFLKNKQASCRNYHFNSEDKYALMSAVDDSSPGAIPYTVLIKPGGEVLYSRLGLIDPLELRRVIVDYLGRFYFRE